MGGNLFKNTATINKKHIRDTVDSLFNSHLSVLGVQTYSYIGSTGKSTGPHLHYEVIESGKKINSQKLKLPSGKVLKSNERKIFEVQKIKLDVLKSELIIGLN